MFAYYRVFYPRNSNRVCLRLLAIFFFNIDGTVVDIPPDIGTGKEISRRKIKIPVAAPGI